VRSDSLVARVASALEARGVPYAMIGAAALAAHGIARSTFDIDLFTTAVDPLDPDFWTHPAIGTDVHVAVRRGEDDDPLSGVVGFSADGQRDVDLVVGRWKWQAEVVARATEVEFAGMSVPVVQAADLVLLKLYAGGSQDCWDVEQLLAGAPRAALIAVVNERVGALPPEARRLWTRLTARE
jgi:predicted nucleotidyltransferase